MTDIALRTLIQSLVGAISSLAAAHLLTWALLERVSEYHARYEILAEEQEKIAYRLASDFRRDLAAIKTIVKDGDKGE